MPGRPCQPLLGNELFLEYEDVVTREEPFTAASISSNDRAALLDAVLSISE